MIIEARNGAVFNQETGEQIPGGILLNEDTGKPIKGARWANLDTGDFEAFCHDAAGEMVRPFRTYKGKAKLRYIAGSVMKHLSRPGSETPLDECRQEILKGKTVKPILLLSGEEAPECEERFCHRKAVYTVSDEVEVEPAIGADGKPYERAVTTQGRAYCERHYRSPRFTSIRGVEREVETTVRPQW